MWGIKSLPKRGRVTKMPVNAICRACGRPITYIKVKGREVCLFCGAGKAG